VAAKGRLAPDKSSVSRRCILAVRRRAFEDVGGSIEEFSFYAEEADLCARLKTGRLGVVFVPQVQVMHVRGADSTKKTRRTVSYACRWLLNICWLRKYLPSWKVRVYARLEVAHFCEIAVDPQAPKSVRWIELQLCSKIRMFGTIVDLERVLRNWS